MKAKDLVIIALLLSLAVVTYFLGQRSGELRDIRMREARARLHMNLRLYEIAQKGDLQKVQNDLEVIVLGQTRTYEQHFGAPTGTDSFAPRFATAQTIAAQVESRMVPFSAILTNLDAPDAKVPVDGKSR